MPKDARSQESCRNGHEPGTPPSLDREAAAAKAAYERGDLDESFRLLERAHILGQPWAGPHSWTHWWMLKIGWKRRDPREIRGQLLRLAAGGLLSWVGWLPVGNTGGANVPPKKPLPLPGDLVRLCKGGAVPPA